MVKISVVINTLNEEKNLPSAIDSVKGLADEVIVVDMMSDDGTREVAEKLGAKVYEHKRMGYVEPARNFAISKAGGEWVLILDADERVPKKLTERLREIRESDYQTKEKHWPAFNLEDSSHSRRVHPHTPGVVSSSADYYRIPRKNIIFGKWIKHSRWWPDYNIRFFRKGYVSWNEIIHSVPLTKGGGADLEAREENAIVHYHYQSIEQYIERLNRYTTHQAKLLIEDGYKFNWRDLVGKPTGEFLSRYFQGEGYKDGLHGLALASLQSFSELVLYLKVWELQKKFKEKSLDIEKVVGQMKKSQLDINYWQADTLVKEVGGFTNKVRRKLKM